MKHWWHRAPLVAVASAACVLLGACAGLPGTENVALERPGITFPRDDGQGFVDTDGTDFTLEGEPYRFVGVNIYDAAASDRYACDRSLQMSPQVLEDTMRELHDVYGVTVVRFWAYQPYTSGGTDFTAIDRVIATAREVGIRLLPVLEDGPGHCTTMDEVVPKAEYLGDTWFTEGYQVPYGTARLSFRDYAQVMAARYRDEPTILGWSLMNEADTSARDGQDRSVLIDFTRDVAGLVRAADPNHLITVGTQSNGARGASGTDFLAVYGLPEVDFAEVHDWGYWGSDSEAMPGGEDGVPPDPRSSACQSIDAPIGCSFAFLPQLGKPLFVGEAGIGADDAGSRTTRAGQLRAKMDAAFAHGAAGYLAWRITTSATDQYDITLVSNDPLLNELAQVSADVQGISR